MAMDIRNGNLDVNGVVLAGGLSRRMGGGDKSLALLGGRPMIARALDCLARQVGSIVINANGDHQRFADLDYEVVADTVEGHAGPLAGILAGMRWSCKNSPRTRFIVSAAADTPFLPDDLVAKLSNKAGESTIVLAKSGGRIHPVAGLWPVALVDDLDTYLKRGGNRKVLAFIDNYTLATVSFPMKLSDSLDPFFNVNTPEDLAKAEELLLEVVR